MFPSTSSSSYGRNERPPSSASMRPTSSASQRIPSSMSNRPLSSASNRPLSRISHRPSSRHARSRLLPLCQALVTQITGLSQKDEDEETYKEAVDYVLKNLEATKGSPGLDMSVMDKQIRGHAQKSRIHSQDELAEALETSYKNLKIEVAKGGDLDKDIRMSRLPDHLQFLIRLSLPPDAVSLAYAELYLHDLRNPPPPPATLTWKDILAEEPFEGPDWEGVYGMPPGSVIKNPDWDGGRSGGSTPSLSPLGSDDLELDMDDSMSSLEDEAEETHQEEVVASIIQPQSKPPHTYAHRKEFEDLQCKQYWRPEWKTDADISKSFDLGDASTLGPSIRRVLASASGESRLGLSIDMPEQERYIDEQDVVREILMVLQGRKNILLQWTKTASGEGSFTPSPTAPRIIHLSLSSQSSIISSLARIATAAQRLREFTSTIFTQSQYHISTHERHKHKPGITTTLEAFADAVDSEIKAFDAWCAGKEEVMCRAQAGVYTGPVIVSLLSTEKAVRDTFEGSFSVLWEVVMKVFASTENGSDNGKGWALPEARIPPAAVTALLLDTLFLAVQENVERGEQVTADTLMRVFVRSAEPVWQMVGRWLRDGMGMGMTIGDGSEKDGELDDEFFIESTGLGVGMMGMGLLDPDFWAEGYSLRAGVGDDEDSRTPKTRTIPVFLQHVAEPILGSGKATGLLRALGIPPSMDGELWLDGWRPFSALVSSEVIPSSLPSTSQRQGNSLFSVSVDTLSRLVYDQLLPHCLATGALLAKTLVDECDLWHHLSTVEGLFLMRKGDAMSHFTDVLFAKMDSRQAWNDFHFLNTAFCDVVEANLGSNAGALDWVQTSLVRLSYRGNQERGRTISRTVKAIDGLLVEYALPFPLTYIFSPRVLQVYSEIFVFLLQIRRAKTALEKILVRAEGMSGGRLRNEMKAFYAMRSRLSWFINTFLNFLTTYVIHTQVVKFHDIFRKAESLDEMIECHDEHLGKIQGRCLLRPNTSSLHRAVLSILDMCIHFTDFFVSFAGDTTLDISRQSITVKRHRSRRQRRQRRNTIGFSHILQFQDSSDEDEDENDFDNDVGENSRVPEPSFSMAVSASSGEDDFSSRLDKMSTELDGLVRFIRRGVESLAGGTGEAAPAFGVLAFALEDWDN